MKSEQKTKIVIPMIVLMCLIGLSVYSKFYYDKIIELENKQLLVESDLTEDTTKLLAEQTIPVTDENTEPEIVFDGLTLDELTDKLERSLNSSLSGYGYLFATHSIELGLDPYLAVAIALHETGCSWECSGLVNACYNVGGMKGAPGCWGGEYMAFNSMEEGIVSFLDNLYNNYVAKGLTTPEEINTRYASSQVWHNQINAYIEKIKAA